MMSQSQHNADKTMLTTRLINHLPFVSSVKGFYPSARELYLNTKIASPFLQAGLDYAENSVASVSAPFVSRYEKIDSFAANQLEKLGEVYEEGLPSLAKKSALTGVRAVAYPVGFTLQMAHQARGLALELASPVIERAYDVANGLIDNLLPADLDEGLYEDVSGLSKMQRKSPARRLRRRLNAQSVMNLPLTSFYYSKGLALDLSYKGVVVGKVMRDQFLMNLNNSLQLLSGLEGLVLARPVAFAHKNIEELLVNALTRADCLKERLDGASLPQTAHLVDRVTSDLRKLASLFGIHVVLHKQHLIGSSSSSTSRSQKRSTPNRRVQTSYKHESPHRIFSDEQRLPSFFLGNNAVSHAEHIEFDRTPTMMSGEGVNTHSHAEHTEFDRTPTIMGGEGVSAHSHHSHHVEHKHVQFDRTPTIISGEGVNVASEHSEHIAQIESERTPTIMIGEVGDDSESSSSSLPGSENASEADDSEIQKKSFLTAKQAGYLFLSKRTPPTPANSPVPQPTSTPNMPVVIVTDTTPKTVDTEIMEEELNGQHKTFHMPKITMEKRDMAIHADANPFDALNNASESMDAEEIVPKKHHSNHHHHGHGDHHHKAAGQASV